ncbi:MAG: hypothetical protein JOZ96_11755 [Acidobacteria bacterium]|nr:hypothetical protein [Acidobacteriota bacterium]
MPTSPANLLRGTRERKRVQPSARLGGFGAARVAAEDFAEGGAVVAVSFRRGVEVEDDAEAAVAVEPVVSANGKKRGVEGYDQPLAFDATSKKILEDASRQLNLENKGKNVVDLASMRTIILPPLDSSHAIFTAFQRRSGI